MTAGAPADPRPAAEIGTGTSANSRERILARIRSAVAGAPDAPITRSYRTSPEATDVIGLFAERVADYRAVVHVVDGSEAAATIRAAMARQGAVRLVVPDGLPAEWAPDDPVADDPRLTAAELDAVDGVITGCAVGIAETGTIVLDAGPGQGRRALTLVPDYHLCVVRADQIVAGVPEAVARLDPARPLTWISGPSATSDIELNRVEGVHGPRTLEVVVVR
ncbi:L-lactate dehydrogenase complex protein LldG [Streptosporangium becharense]|uniref:L-lactate dehydrogenase complex protein LldG n=1 Tax=Streptosporangium becharense TaxID=1816182 RepID=A0A7W9IJP6_9ACTN|nr:LUD domain-containing protein [Streptosporangium becharense]MBB2910972.1 L-lactate dehydrogenase complex protein LldG [Streptosporangium becharense]MBB5821970.1 L-lactate dehydrogenase complex protein LldG [Streptosporangium becharense]